MSFIKIDRKISHWEWYGDPVVLTLWIHILIEANYVDKEWQGIKVGAGELLTSVAKLSQTSGQSIQQTRTALKKLESTNEITCKTTNKYTLIHVNKWNEYQTNNKQVTSKSTNKSTSHLTTTKEVQEIQEYKNIYNPPIIPPQEDCSPEFAEALDAFAEMRRRIRKPLTDRAKQMILNKLKKLAIDEETQIEILNQSTMNSWQGVFPLDEQRRRKGMVNVLDL